MDESTVTVASSSSEDEDEIKKQVIIVNQLNYHQDPTVENTTEEYLIVSEDQNESNLNNETWNVIGSYDVEESGALVPFNSDRDVLMFQEDWPPM